MFRQLLLANRLFEIQCAVITLSTEYNPNTHHLNRSGRYLFGMERIIQNDRHLRIAVPDGGDRATPLQFKQIAGNSAFQWVPGFHEGNVRQPWSRIVRTL